MAVDWSDVPIDLLIVIAMKLENIEDFVYFSAVCREWSDISSQIKHRWRGIPVPWLFLAENKNENPNCLRKIYNPINNKCYHLNLPETFGNKCWGTSYGWVVMIKRDLNVLLFNPITKAQIRFPSSESISSGDSFDKLIEEDPAYFLCNFFRKIILLKVSQGDNDEFLIMALTLDCLAFARQRDQCWTTLLSDKNLIPMQCLLDIVGVGDRVFALYSDGSLVYWNAKDFQVGKVVKAIDFAPVDNKVNNMIHRLSYHVHSVSLVHLDGEVIMVLRKKVQMMKAYRNVDCLAGHKTSRFIIRRLDPKEKAWRKLEDLGDMTMFAGHYSHVTLAKSLKHNCIYFTDDDHNLMNFPSRGHDMGLYDIRCKEIERFYDGGDFLSLYSPPTWFVPQH